MGNKIRVSGKNLHARSRKILEARRYCVKYPHSYLIGVFHLREKTGVPKERNSRRIKTRLELQALGGAIPRRVRPRGYRFQRPPAERREAPAAERSEAVPPSEARPSHRAKRGSTEAPPERSEAARRSSGGRHYKKTQKGSTRKPSGTTYFQNRSRNFGGNFFLLVEPLSTPERSP